MCPCCKKIPWRKVFLAAIIYLIIAVILRQLEVVLTMKYYLMPQYFGIWSKVMMPTAGPPPTSFMVLSLLFTLVTGIVLASFFACIKEILGGGYWKKVFNFTGIVISLMLVFAYLPMYLLINLPLGLLVWWFVTGTITLFLGAAVFVKFMA